MVGVQDITSVDRESVFYFELFNVDGQASRLDQQLLQFLNVFSQLDQCGFIFFLTGLDPTHFKIRSNYLIKNINELPKVIYQPQLILNKFEIVIHLGDLPLNQKEQLAFSELKDPYTCLMHFSQQLFLLQLNIRVIPNRVDILNWPLSNLFIFDISSLLHDKLSSILNVVLLISRLKMGVVTVLLDSRQQVFCSKELVIWYVLFGLVDGNWVGFGVPRSFEQGATIH